MRSDQLVQERFGISEFAECTGLSGGHLRLDAVTQGGDDGLDLGQVERLFGAGGTCFGRWPRAPGTRAASDRASCEVVVREKSQAAELFAEELQVGLHADDPRRRARFGGRRGRSGDALINPSVALRGKTLKDGECKLQNANCKMNAWKKDRCRRFYR